MIKMNRRFFIKTSALLSAGVHLPTSARTSESDVGKIMTVDGPIAPDQLGTCLTHEHLMSTFGDDARSEPGYDEAALLNQVVPYLKHVKQLGAQSVADCTGAYFGRDVRLLQQLAQRSGVQIITNTGYYGAANDRYVPEHACQESAETIAQRWITEFKQGIDGTDVRPGFIKIALDSGPVSDIDAKLLWAAALTHTATGLTIACHTGNNPAGAKTALTILKEEGVAPAAWIWTHANKVERTEDLLFAARSGAWISLDGVRTPDPTASELGVFERHLRYLKELKAHDLLSRVLLSHDGNSFPRGGAIRPYEAIFTALLPRLAQEGFSPSDIRQLMVDNPARAFTIEKSKA